MAKAFHLCPISLHFRKSITFCSLHTFHKTSNSVLDMQQSRCITQHEERSKTTGILLPHEDILVGAPRKRAQSNEKSFSQWIHSIVCTPRSLKNSGRHNYFAQQRNSLLYVWRKRAWEYIKFLQLILTVEKCKMDEAGQSKTTTASWCNVLFMSINSKWQSATWSRSINKMMLNYFKSSLLSRINSQYWKSHITYHYKCTNELIKSLNNTATWISLNYIQRHIKIPCKSYCKKSYSPAMLTCDQPKPPKGETLKQVHYLASLNDET